MAAPAAAAATSSSRRFGSLYHVHHQQPQAPAERRDQVVVGLAASVEDGVEDWSADFLGGAELAPSPRWRPQDSAVTDPHHLSLLPDASAMALSLHKRRSSSSSGGVARPASRRSSGGDLTSQHSNSSSSAGAAGRHSGGVVSAAADETEGESRTLFQVQEQPSIAQTTEWKPSESLVRAQSQLDSEDDDPHGFWSSFSTVKEVRVGRPRQLSDVQDDTEQAEDAEAEDEGLGGGDNDNEEEDDDEDEDWDAEFGFDEQTDAGNFGSTGSMDPTRRRAENGNFFLPNLHEVLDGESLPDDDEMDDLDSASPAADGKSRRPRRASEEPLFQRRRSDFQQSAASLDGSLDGIRASLTSASSAAIEYSLVDKLRLLEVASSSAYAVRIERYPKPSTTFSNLERDWSFPSFAENKYERWLADLVVPECAVVSQHLEAERNRMPPQKQQKTLFHTLVSLPFGREFVVTFFKQVAHYQYFGEEKENRELVRVFFEKVSTTGMADDSWSNAMAPIEFDFVVGCTMEILQEAALMYGPKPVVPPANHLSLSMLSTTSGSSSASSQGNKATVYWMQQFQDIIMHCAEAFPQYRNVIALIELRYVCHHLAGFANGEFEYKWQLCNHLPQLAPLEPLASDSAARIVNEVLQFYGALFRHLNTSPESRSNRYTTQTTAPDEGNLQTDDRRHFGLSPDVICLQALVLCDIQSLYDSKSALAEVSIPALEELFEFEDDEATVDPILVGLLPGRDSRSSSAASNPESYDTAYERGDLSKGLGGWSGGSKLFKLLRPSSRTRSLALSFFFERISGLKFPLVKAKCASVLAGIHVSTTSLGNLRVAESLAYEALRLLEICSSKRVAKLSKMPSLRGGSKVEQESYLSIFTNDGLLSDLGRDVLESLGNILIKNNKYRYGILCLEAAGALFTFLNQGGEYEKLDRLLCKLTLEADDVHRALPLHEKVTCAAQRQGNITVYVYLTQELTKLWIREGNFTRAEEYLATACHFLRDHTNLLPPFFLSSVINASYSSSEATSSRSGTMMTATSSSASSSLSGSFHLSRSTGNAGEMDTWLNHDISLHLLVREVYRSSGRCLEGMRVLEHLLNYSPRLPRGKRTQLRMLLAEDALKMRMFDTCRHMFALLDKEAAAFCDRLQENIKGFSGLGSSSGNGAGGSSSGGRSLGGMGSEARCCFDMVFSLRYITCRAKMYLKLGEHSKAFAWLSLAHVKTDRENGRKQAQLHVLDGKVLRAYCREQQEREQERLRNGEESARRDHSLVSTFVGSVVSPAQVEEMLKPLGGSMYGLNKEEKERLHERMVLFAACVRDLDKAEEQAEQAFWTAFDLYRTLGDCLYQLKVLLEIVAFMLAPIERSFFALGSNQDDEKLKSHLHRRSSGKGASVLEVEEPAVMLGGDDTIEKARKALLEAQKLLRPALNLAEQVADPASFLRTLIYCSEVWVWLERIASYKSEKHLKEATAFWEEAVRVMKAVFFRRVAFHDASDSTAPYSSVGFGRDFLHPYAHGGTKGRFCVVPILNFSEGFILKLEAMTLQLILTACQLQQFERVPEYVEETLLLHLDELLSARMCLSSIAHQLQTFRALQRSHKRLPPSGSTTNLAAVAAGMPSGSSASSVGSSSSRSSSFSAVIPVPSPQTGGSAKIVSTMSPSGGVAGGKRGGHKKNQSMSSISELLASNAPPPSPFHDSTTPMYGSSNKAGTASAVGGGGAMKSAATPRTGLASLSERPNAPPPPIATAVKTVTPPAGSYTVKKIGDRKSRTRERSRSAPQPAVPNAPSPNVDTSFSRTDGPGMPAVAETGESSVSTMKRTSSVKFIDLGDLRSWPSAAPGEGFVLGEEDGFVREEGSSSNGAMGLCDFDEVQSEKLWWIFNLWRDAKAKYVDGKLETAEFRSRNLRYLRTLLDAFDPQQIAVLYFGGLGSPSAATAVTPTGGRVAGNPNGMLGFDVAHMNSHALIQDRQLVLSIGYEVASEAQTPFGTTSKLQFKVFHVREGDTSAWRQEIPRPEWYLADYDLMEAEEAAVGAGVLRTMRLLGAKLLLKLLGLLMLETSVVVVGTSYPQIQEVTLSLLKLLEPFRWQHTFLPFVPVTSWRFLHDAAFQHAQTELAARPKSRKSFSRLSHEWRWGGGSGSSIVSGSQSSSSRGSTDSMTGASSNSIGAGGVAVNAASAVDGAEEEPPFLMGATTDTWQSCLAFARSSGGDPRVLTSFVAVVDLDDVAAFANDRTLRNAVPLPKKWRRQFLERFEKVVKQRRKVHLKMSRRHSSQQLVASRGGPTTPASASAVTTPQSLRSPVDSYRQLDMTLRSFDDALSSSRSASSWMTPLASAPGAAGSDAGSNYQLLSSGVRPSEAGGLEERLFYDSECATAFVSGLREFYDKVLGLCAEKDRKAKGKKKKSPSSSSGHSKRQEIKSWFSSSHDFDAFVDNFQASTLLVAFEKEKAASQAEAQAQALQTSQQLERQTSDHEPSSTSSGRSAALFAMMASSSTTPASLINSFTPQQLKSFGSLSSMGTASNHSLGGSGGQERKR
ncbi:hypothetical protein BBJ28_00005239 [Nothophytophthora sp. Chile5]|nr:hypothetical protein BBJ28_00005239 [Nothophytophthora sp. Chile5]